MTLRDHDTPPDMAPPPVSPNERRIVLDELEGWLEKPMLVLAFVWLALLIVELARGLPPSLEIVGTGIWVVFILDFTLRLWLAPDRSDYLRHNWLTALSLVLPALRVFRIVTLLRFARAARVFQGVTRGARVVRVVSSVNRGMAALRRTMARRGLGFVIILTMLVLLAGAAGMYAFERELQTGRGFDSFWTALWWTAMLLTTMGSEYWPRSPEGRVLCLLLAMYAFAVFGYVTASLASYFIGRDADEPTAEIAGTRALDAIRAELVALRREVHVMAARTGERAPPTSAPDVPPHG